MRSSDWSSDVCSSDLAAQLAARRGGETLRPAGRQRDEGRCFDKAAVRRRDAVVLLHQRGFARRVVESFQGFDRGDDGHGNFPEEKTGDTKTPPAVAA